MNVLSWIKIHTHHNKHIEHHGLNEKKERSKYSQDARNLLEHVQGYEEKNKKIWRH